MIREDSIEILKKQEGLLIRPTYRKIPGHPIVIDKQILPEIMSYRGNEGMRGAIKSCSVNM